MNKFTRTRKKLGFTIASLFCLPMISIAHAQTPDNNHAVSVLNQYIAAQNSNIANGSDNRMDALKTRRFSCSLNQIPGNQYTVAYTIGIQPSELEHIHNPIVFGAGSYIMASDAYSLYQFDHANKGNKAIITPEYTSNHIVLGVSDKSLVQKHRIDKQSCVTRAPLSDPATETTLFCSDTYYKAQYHNDAVYILSDIQCIPENNRKTCKNKPISVERYLLDGTKSWRMTLDDMRSASIVGKWNQILLILSANASLVALDTETGSVIYTKNLLSKLPLETDYYQFNHFYVDRAAGLFIVASRFHDKIAVIDIQTGSIVKTHDFVKAYAHHKYLDGDYHYIELGEYAFPLNTIMGIDNGVMYLRKEKNILAAVELKTGKQLWKYDIYKSPLNTTPAVNREDIGYHVGDILITDELVIVGYNKFATALNKTTGSVVWDYSLFPFKGHFGYQMWLSCVDNHLMIQSDGIYRWP